MWAAIIGLLTSLPQIIKGILALWDMWQNMREEGEKQADEQAIKKEVDDISVPGGRPSAL